MDATKRCVTGLKPSSKKKLLLKGPTAEGLEKVAKGIKAFSPKSQVQLLEAIPSSPQSDVSTPPSPPVLQDEDKIRVAGMKDPNAPRRVERVGLLPKPPGEELEAPIIAPAPALPWELYSTEVRPTQPIASASSPSLSRPAAAGGDDSAASTPPLSVSMPASGEKKESRAEKRSGKRYSNSHKHRVKDVAANGVESRDGHRKDASGSSHSRNRDEKKERSTNGTDNKDEHRRDVRVSRGSHHRDDQPPNRGSGLKESRDAKEKDRIGDSKKSNNRKLNSSGNHRGSDNSRSNNHQSISDSTEKAPRRASAKKPVDEGQ